MIQQPNRDYFPNSSGWYYHAFPPFQFFNMIYYDQAVDKVTFFSVHNHIVRTKVEAAGAVFTQKHCRTQKINNPLEGMTVIPPFQVMLMGQEHRVPVIAMEVITQFCEPAVQGLTISVAASADYAKNLMRAAKQGIDNAPQLKIDD